MNTKVSGWRQLGGLMLTPFGIFIFIPLAVVIVEASDLIIWVYDKAVR